MTATLDITDGLATITLARPTAHNALDVTTKKALLDAVTAAAGDATVRAVLIAGQGRNFCVGQDLGEHVATLEADPSSAMDTVADHYNPLIRALAAVEVPVVAAVTGACVGAGWGISLTADILIAGEKAFFAAAFSGIGLAADSGLSYSLVTCLGPARARELLLRGTKVTAAQALDWGLVDEIVADDQVGPRAERVARNLAEGPTAAFRQIKSLVGAAAAGLTQALEREQVAQAVLGQSDDHKAAVAAFFAKEKPHFVGH